MAPSRVFIVPYRDRSAQRATLLDKLNQHLHSDDDWEIFFIHQCDRRPFNRGAMKNIGFLFVKSAYPRDYEDITIVFHDVDTWPTWPGQFPYTTVRGVVAHYYGVAFALGGVVAIKAGDFEKTGGFANFWGWGLEDNVLQDRCLAAGLEIDRRVFFHLRDKSVLRAFDGFNRNSSPREASVYKYGSPDGLRDLHDVGWTTGAGGMVNVATFSTRHAHDQQAYTSIDIRSGTRLRADRRLLAGPGLQSAVRPHTGQNQLVHLSHRGRKKIKAPLGGLIRRWPPR